MSVGVQRSYKRYTVVHNDRDDGSIGDLERLLLLSGVVVATNGSQLHDVWHTQTGGNHIRVANVAAVIPDLGGVDKLGDGGGDSVAGASKGRG